MRKFDGVHCQILDNRADSLLIKHQNLTLNLVADVHLYVDVLLDGLQGADVEKFFEHVFDDYRANL